MSFKPIPVERKVEVIYRVVKGEKIQPIVREAGVDRISIYLWKERALSALREALEPRKRGPKFKKSPKDKEIEKLKEKDKQIRELKEKLNPPKKEVKSVKCPILKDLRRYTKTASIKGSQNGSGKGKLKIRPEGDERINMAISWEIKEGFSKREVSKD